MYFEVCLKACNFESLTIYNMLFVHFSGESHGLVLGKFFHWPAMLLPFLSVYSMLWKILHVTYFLYIKNTVLHLYLAWSLNYIVAIRLLDFSGWIYVRDESTTRDKLAIELNFCSICPLGHDTLNLCFCVSWDLSLGFY